MSSLTEAMIVNGFVLVTVLASDTGPARKIGIGRLIRPVIAAAVIIPLFVDSPVTHGRGLFWTAVIAARAAFTYGAAHWFSSSMVSWAIARQVSQAAITDGLIFMAIAMILVRTGSLRVRAARLSVGTPALANGQIA
jgi:hypothetical protein